MISDWALMRDSKDLILNWYGNSEMTTTISKDLSVTIKQETDYPASQRIRIKISPSKPAQFGLKLRIPHWSDATKVKLNGRVVPSVQAGHYLSLQKKWRKGDTIQIDLDMSLHYWIGQRDCKGLTSIYRGPILLAFDHRYNLHLSPKGKKKVRDYQEKKEERLPRLDYLLNIPVLNAKNMKEKRLQWDDWLSPILLLQFKAANGKIVNLCDFGSAGEVGTPYMSWLKVKNLPAAASFSPNNPLRSVRF